MRAASAILMVEQLAAPILSETSRIAMPALSIIEEGGACIVGDPVSATFLTLPKVGVVAIRALQNGATVAEAAAAASGFAGEEVDVLGFVGVLAESGLVCSIDGSSLAAHATHQPENSWLEGVRPEVVRPFFSRPAWTFYAIVAAYCLAVIGFRPHYWPTFHDFFFTSDAAICVVTALIVRMGLASIHEACHWLAARAAGVAARFSLSRRLYYVVFETDLSQLWSVPRRRRYGPFLAGMAFDALVLALCLTVRLLYDAHAIHPPSVAVKFVASVALAQVIGIGWQMLVFLRTDLYAVMITALGCTNLYRVNRLTLKRRFRGLSPAEEEELGGATAPDLRAVRWFSWLSIAGVVWAAYVFAAVFVPSTAIAAVWMFARLGGLHVTTRPFWEALVLGVIFALDFVLPIGVFARERIKARR